MEQVWELPPQCSPVLSLFFPLSLPPLLDPDSFDSILYVFGRFYGTYCTLSCVLSQSKHIHFELGIIQIKPTPAALLQSNQKKEKQLTK